MANKQHTLFILYSMLDKKTTTGGTAMLTAPFSKKLALVYTQVKIDGSKWARYTDGPVTGPLRAQNLVITGLLWVRYEPVMSP